MAISKIKIGSTEHELQTTIANVSGLQTALNDKASTAIATTSANGLMSKEDKVKLDSLTLSSASAIIDVLELPTLDIIMGNNSKNAIYRLMVAKLLFEGKETAFSCYCVDGLPSEGLPATDAAFTTGNIYYNVQDGVAYGYVDSSLSGAMGIPVGWYTGDVLIGGMGYTYLGVFKNMNELPYDSVSNSFCVLIDYELYHYMYREDDDVHVWKRIEENLDSYGSHSAIPNGRINIAWGSYANAEGMETVARGMASHTEGRGTRAGAAYAHAEGENTYASSMGAHSEGIGTIAGGMYQHAQGKYNIADNSNKYAHIVGMGTNDEERANAHTLDWDGNAWFAGDIYIGGTGQSDTTAKKLATTAIATTSANGLMSSAMVGKLNGIEAGANKTIIDNTLLSDSTTEALSAAAGKALDKRITAMGEVCINTIALNLNDVNQKLNEHTHDYNKLTNTPCGEAFETVLEETLTAWWYEAQNNWEDDLAHYQYSSAIDTSSFTHGGLYTITIGDTVYTNVVCFEASTVDSQIPTGLIYVFGNPSVIGFPADTGEPFIVIIDNAGAFMQNGLILKGVSNYVPTPENPIGGTTTATINVKIEASTGVKQLDNKYLEILEEGESSGSETLTWDGNTDGLVPVMSSEIEPGVISSIYKISDAAPTVEQASAGGTMSIFENGTIQESIFTAENIEAINDALSLYMVGTDAGANVIVALEDNIDIDTMVFPEKGIYTSKITGDGIEAYTTSWQINGYTFGGNGYKIKPEYLPDEITNVSTQIQESLNGLKFVVLSQAEYDALTTKDANTIYYIYEEV